MQHWALLLSAYLYDILFRPTGAHGNADGLESQMQITSDDATVFNLAQIQSLPVLSSDLETATRNDPLLNKVLQYVRQGWPLQVPEVLHPYWLKRHELMVEGDTLLWGVWVEVPSKLLTCAG